MFYKLILSILIAGVLSTGFASDSGSGSEIEVYFSPHGGCTDAIVSALNGAKQTVLVQAYSFTSAPIAKALAEAHRRGVDVKLILDKTNRTRNYSSADFVVHEGIPTWIDTAHTIAHNKILILDSQTVITGSFNFTKAAELHNAENLLVIHDPALAKKYTENWLRCQKQSEPYLGR